jgi:phosphotransferase system HPr (HPr) family protein
VIEKAIPISNRLGLHARAAAKLVHTASRFQATVRIRKDDEEVDGKSILGILLLAAAQGSTVTVRAEGQDEAEAVGAVEDLIVRRFDEDE